MATTLPPPPPLPRLALFPRTRHIISLRSASPRRPVIDLLPVDTAPEPANGGEYRPSFFDDLLLAFYWSKMVEVHTEPEPVKGGKYRPSFDDLLLAFYWSKMVEGIAWLGMKMVWQMVIPMLRCWKILTPVKDLAGFDAALSLLEKMACSPTSSARCRPSKWKDRHTGRAKLTI